MRIPGRVTAFVADITQPGSLDAVPRGSMDFVTMVFVLSAISPERMGDALANVAAVLKPGTGKVLFRDYALGDQAQDKHQVGGHGCHGAQCAGQISHWYGSA